MWKPTRWVSAKFISHPAGERSKRMNAKATDPADDAGRTDPVDDQQDRQHKERTDSDAGKEDPYADAARARSEQVGEQREQAQK